MRCINNFSITEKGSNMSIINNQGLTRSDKDIENDRLIKEYLDNGGAVTKCNINARSEEVSYSNSWGKRKPQAKPKEE
jgi:hypothetical protein